MLKKITCNRIRKLIAIKEKVSLYSNKITFSYNQWLHLGSSQYKQFPQKKRMEGVCPEEKEEGRMRRGKEERENERKEVKKRRRRKWMERVYVEGMGKGRMICGRKEERKEKDKKGEEEKEE